MSLSSAAQPTSDRPCSFRGSPSSCSQSTAQLSLFLPNLPWAALLKGRRRQLHFPFGSVTLSSSQQALKCFLKGLIFQRNIPKALKSPAWVTVSLDNANESNFRTVVYCSCRIYVKITLLCFSNSSCASFQLVWNWTDDVCWCNRIGDIVREISIV